MIDNAKSRNPVFKGCMKWDCLATLTQKKYQQTFIPTQILKINRTSKKNVIKRIDTLKCKKRGKPIFLKKS